MPHVRQALTLCPSPPFFFATHRQIHAQTCGHMHTSKPISLNSFTSSYINGHFLWYESTFFLKKKKNKPVLLSSICRLSLNQPVLQPCSVICLLLIIHRKHSLCTLQWMLRVMKMLWSFYHGLSGAARESNQISDKRSVLSLNSIWLSSLPYK